MAGTLLNRRRSDEPDFLNTDVDVAVLADEIFARYAGPQPVVIDGVPSTATFFEPGYCPDYRVMKLAGALAVRVNHHAIRERDAIDGVRPLRVTVAEIMLAALLHDLGKQHEDCAPLITLLHKTDLRGESAKADPRTEYLLNIVRDVHCRKGPCMIDRLRHANRSELNSAFYPTVARRHGDDYAVNRSVQQGCWWAREINVVTIADDYDAMISQGPERAYKSKALAPAEAAAILRAGIRRGRYERRLAEIFVTDVIGQAGR